jgi:carboxylesterase type B
MEFLLPWLVSAASGRLNKNSPPTAVDWQLSDQMIAYWTQFATLGDPNADGLPDWPFFDAPDYQVMEFANLPSPTAAPERILCRVFRESID